MLIKTKYMSGHRNVRRSHYMKTDNRNFSRVELIKYCQTNITVLNCIQEEVNSRLKSGNIFCLPLQNILSFILLSKNINNKITSNNILPVVLKGMKLGAHIEGGA